MRTQFALFFRELTPFWISPDLITENTHLLVMVLPFGEKRPEDFYYIYGTEQELRNDKQILEILRCRQLLTPEPYMAVVHHSRVKNKNHVRTPLWHWVEKEIRKRTRKKRSDLTYIRHAGKITKRIKMPYVIQFQSISQHELTKKQLKEVNAGRPIKPKLKMLDLAKDTHPAIQFLQQWLPGFTDIMINCRCVSTPITFEDKPNAKI